MKHTLKYIGIFIGLATVGTANAQSLVFEREIADVLVGWTKTPGMPETFNFNHNTTSVGTGHFWFHDFSHNNTHATYAGGSGISYPTTSNPEYSISFGNSFDYSTSETLTRDFWIDYDYELIFTVNDPGALTMLSVEDEITAWQPNQIERGTYNGTTFTPQSVFVDCKTLADSSNNSIGIAPGQYRLKASYSHQWTVGQSSFRRNGTEMQFTAVPEPASMAALGIGLVGIFAKRRKAK